MRGRTMILTLLVFGLHTTIAAGAEKFQPVSIAEVPYARYVVTVGEAEEGSAESVGRELANLYGGRLEPYAREGGRQFMIGMSAARARVMSLDPRVAAVVEQVPAAAAEAPRQASPGRTLVPRPAGSGTMSFDSYTYDGSGNIKSIGMGAGQQEEYRYDLLGRLTSATAGVTNTQTYEYDAFGNRKNATRLGQSSACTGDAACEQPSTASLTTNRLTVNGATYDVAGNLTAYGSGRHAYDSLGMMTRAVMGSIDRQFLYTADDERIAIYDSFNWTWTVRGADGKVLREFTSTNDVAAGTLGTKDRKWIKDYIWRDGLLLSTENAKGTATVRFDYHLDHLGTPRLVTDGSGVKVSTHTYYAFGAELKGTPESPEEAMKFTGHERDTTGTSEALDMMHARYYSSLTGRLLSVDPAMDLKKTMANPQMWNRYSYVVNNPIRFTDPDGREHVYEPGFTKPLSEANDWSEYPSVSWAFYAQGGLLAAGAGGAIAELGTSAVSAYQTWRAVRTGQAIATTATAAYKVAAAGGTHAGYLRNMASRPLNQIGNAIRGYDKVIQQHIGWLKDPTLKVADWAQKTAAEQQIIRQKWLDDIARNRQLQDVMQGLYNALTK